MEDTKPEMDVMTTSMYVSEPSSDSEQVDKSMEEMTQDDGIRRRHVNNVSPQDEVNEEDHTEESNEECTEEESTEESNEEDSNEESTEEESNEEESNEEEEEEEEEGEEEESNEDNLKNVTIIQPVIIHKNESIPLPILLTASALLMIYGLQLFFYLCSLTGCTCAGHCICL